MRIRMRAVCHADGCRRAQRVPDLCYVEGLDSKIDGIDRGTTLEDALSDLANHA